MISTAYGLLRTVAPCQLIRSVDFRTRVVLSVCLPVCLQGREWGRDKEIKTEPTSHRGLWIMVLSVRFINSGWWREFHLSSFCVSRRTSFLSSNFPNYFPHKLTSESMTCTAPLASLSQKQLLHLCATVDADSDFPVRIVGALEAELSRPTSQALALLNALCEFTCRGLPGSDGGGAHFQQRVIELLHMALDKNVCAAAEGGQAAERILAVVESLTCASNATCKLSKPGLRRICTFLLTQRRHVPRLAMLVSQGPRLHEACAGATADTLKADAGAGSALSLLAAASRHMRYAAGDVVSREPRHSLARP